MYLAKPTALNEQGFWRNDEKFTANLSGQYNAFTGKFEGDRGVP